MGTIFVDNLEPQSGTSLTLGASGDSIKASTGAVWTGTVAESSSSSVVENGSNSNGKFTKFADGTMICHMNFTFASGSGVTAQLGNGGQVRSNNLTKTLPASFTDTSYQVVMTAGRLFSPSISSSSGALATGSFGYILKGWSAATSDENVEIFAIAIGRWY
jgi:hypothetical protein